MTYLWASISITNFLASYRVSFYKCRSTSWPLVIKMAIFLKSYPSMALLCLSEPCHLKHPRIANSSTKIHQDFFRVLVW